MRRSLTALVLALLFAVGPTAIAGPSADRLWLGPSPGSLDLLRMFEQPDEWPRMRGTIDVFRFIQQHTFTDPHPITGPNTYDALVRVGAFKKLTAWRIKIALEVGAVKDFYCTSDASGMRTAVTNTLDAVDAVQSTGGIVQYLAMDEPFLAGQASRCGGPSLVPTADRLETYFAGVRERHPRLRIGLIEAYPSFKPAAFASMLDLMAARDILPAFVHLDVDLESVRPGREDLAADVRRIHRLCADRDIPFGAIVWGNNGNADALFAADAGRLAGALKEAYPAAGDMPDQLIVYSWSPSSTGALITPTNLPEDRPYTLTNLAWHVFRRFAAAADATVGTAVKRR